VCNRYLGFERYRSIGRGGATRATPLPTGDGPGAVRGPPGPYVLSRRVQHLAIALFIRIVTRIADIASVADPPGHGPARLATADAREVVS